MSTRARGCGLLLLCAGCSGPDGPAKVVVEGGVTYNGVPVQNGEIRFYSIEGTPGPVSGAPIVGGHYEAAAKGGVLVAMRLVRIEAYSPAQSGADDVVTAGRYGARVNYLPDRYHRDSEITMDVTGDSSRMTKDFDLAKRVASGGKLQ